MLLYACAIFKKNQSKFMLEICAQACSSSKIGIFRALHWQDVNCSSKYFEHRGEKVKIGLQNKGKSQ
jgi:hypothetical protein